MSQQSFKPGDQVQLKSGGPKMTILRETGDRRAWVCAWFVGSKNEQASFEAAALKNYEDEEPPMPMMG